MCYTYSCISYLFPKKNVTYFFDMNRTRELPVIIKKEKKWIAHQSNKDILCLYLGC